MVSLVRTAAARHRPPKQSALGVALHFQSIVSRAQPGPSLSGAGFCFRLPLLQLVFRFLRLHTIKPSPAGRLQSDF